MILAHRSSRMLCLGLLLLVAVGPNQARGHSNVSDCVTFQLSESLGENSPTYIWSHLTSKERTATLARSAPPTDHLSLVTHTRDESRFAPDTPIHIDGFGSISASYSHAIPFSKGKALVSLKTELGSLNGKILGLPAYGEVLSDGTKTFYVVEEKGRVMFYPNPDFARTKTLGKTIEEIAAEHSGKDDPTFALALFKDQSAPEPHLMSTFIKDPHDNHWTFDLNVDESAIHPVTPVKLLSQIEFEQAYPHDINNLGKHQSIYEESGNDYLVNGYDPQTGTVSVQREVIKIVDLKTNPTNPNELNTTEKLTLRREHSQNGQSIHSRQINTGDLFTGSNGYTYEVRSYNSQNQAKAFLRRIVQHQISLPVFEANIRQQTSISGLAKTRPKTMADTAQVFLGKLKSLFGSPRNPRSHVKLLGASNISRLSVKKDIFFSAFETEFRGTEITYQLRGSRGISNLKVRVRLRGAGLTKQQLKRVDDLVAQLSNAQADSIHSIDLLDEEGYYAYLNKNPGSDAEGLCSARDVTLFHFFDKEPDKNSNILWHEMGHAIAWKHWGTETPGQEWVRAAVLDGHFISGYSLYQGPTFPIASLHEDFAETVAAYVTTDGGRTQPGLRQAFKNRFEFLDRIFSSH